MVVSSAASMHSNMQSLGQSIGTKMRTLAHLNKPLIEIDFDNSHGVHGKWITSFSTMDTIEGKVTVTTTHDIPFEDIDIALTGTSHVFVERLTATPSVSGRTEATHRFLTLKQPIQDEDFPYPRVLAAGRKYIFPFTFTIPERLLERACPHSVSNGSVRDNHLMLPPSMGDPEVSGFGGTLLDDFAPDMSKIIYLIKVRIIHVREADGSLALLAERTRKIRVKPAFEEQPPLNIDSSSAEYRLRQDKVIRKGLFKGKLGTLTAQSAQPKALMIPGARTTCNDEITTMARVLLRFDPADDNSTPPRLGSLTSKIRISTYYASAPRNSIPARSSIGLDLTQGLYQQTVPLSSLCVASAQWQKHTSALNPSLDESSLIRRDSGISDCSVDSEGAAFNAGVLTASKNYRGNVFYTAQIVVPVGLPLNKNFLPTFHSCLISRTYTLSLQLTVHAPGVSDPSLHLKVPIQICAEGSDTGNENARARNEEATLAREAIDVFNPRSVAPPSSETGGTDDLPPEYAAFVVPGRQQASSHQTRVMAVA